MGYEYLIVDGEKIFTDPMRGYIPPLMPRPRAEDGTLLPRDRPLSNGVSGISLRALADLIRDEVDGTRRRQLEDCYWALVAADDGPDRARVWRRDYEWLRERRRRLEAMGQKPALGAFKGSKVRPGGNPDWDRAWIRFLELLSP